MTPHNSGWAASNRSALKPAAAQAAGDRGDGNGACDDLLHRDVVHQAHLDVRDAQVSSFDHRCRGYARSPGARCQACQQWPAAHRPHRKWRCGPESDRHLRRRNHRPGRTTQATRRSRPRSPATTGGERVTSFPCWSRSSPRPPFPPPASRERRRERWRRHVRGAGRPASGALQRSGRARLPAP